MALLTRLQNATSYLSLPSRDATRLALATHLELQLADEWSCGWLMEGVVAGWRGRERRFRRRDDQ